MAENAMSQAQQSFWDMFWDNAILTLSERKRREIAVAQLIVDLFSKSRNSADKNPNADKKSEENPSDAEQDDTEKNAVEISLKDENPFDELEFIKRKWEMRTKSKL